MDYVDERTLRGQAWKYYALLLAWPAYLVLLPWAFTRWGAPALLFIIFPGLFLFTGLGYLMHECWHRYVPNVQHGFFYNVFSWMMLTDPQLYRLIHGFHHSEVNTYGDFEFHPFGEIRSRAWRRCVHAFEIFIGVAFQVAAILVLLPRHPKFGPKFRLSSVVTAATAWVLIWGGAAWLSRAWLGSAIPAIALSYGLLLWICSVFLHHSQMVEHGNLIVEGSWDQRNVKTRNLRNQTLLEKAFLFLSHHDSQEHVLHHTLVKVHSRIVPGQIPIPAGAVTVSLSEYFGILGDMLSGRASAR